ncbi:AAA family ATPase [Thalassobacillus sp. CUG 92003]|uniref:AAA family ATPase n=1 Tax=Thalassobacillus sp. CUG 92003 TaxID=2736641 RepID=UPI0015E682B0|nr:AAA family ATPase [Thalassobacillus sp. CUG 92003]
MEHSINTLKQWDTLAQKPPMNEVDALRYLDEHEDQLHEEQRLRLYAVLAYYRMKRRVLHDPIAEELMETSRKLDDPPRVIKELQSARTMLHAFYTLQDAAMEQWTMHETDHQTQKEKKANTILERVNALQTDWSYTEPWDSEQDHTDHYRQVETSIHELQQTLFEALNTNEQGYINVPVKHVNHLLRQFKEAKERIYHQLPHFLTDENGTSPLDELDRMIGLADVKAYIRRYYHFLKYQQQRKAYGFSMVNEPGLHMIISGNPGTGKTTIARLLANIYYELGILQTKEVVEVNRSHLVGSYVGQSEENTMNYIKQAVGGVLFIDEAYSLKREGQSGNDFGQAVIDTLVSAMTSQEFGGRFAVILAGYPEEMRQFLWSNPGLRSRIPEQNHITLPDYGMDELIDIAENIALENDYFFTSQALAKLEQIIDQFRVDESFGNARTVRNIILQTIFNKGAKESDREPKHWLDHMRIQPNDLLIEPASEKEGSSLSQLDDLIGLHNVKEEVKKLSSFVEIQQARKSKGLPVMPIELHAVFSGNPGTGKSTVATLYAGILNDCGLLKRGHLIIASRSDLVAGYTGQTAIKTKKKIREALGGVLFIDEAYALYNGGRDDFGIEAIETLVDEMSKHQENLVVILAGYRKKMQELINRNPGLSSRFKKYLHFPDYTASELLEMSKLHATRYGYWLGEESQQFLTERFEMNAIAGNGRFVTNLVNEAVQYQALRLMEEQGEDLNELTKHDLALAWDAIRRET